MRRDNFQRVVIWLLFLILIVGLLFLFFSLRDPVESYIGKIEWQNDEIYLTQNTRSGEYQCFGCNGDICLYPSLLMEHVEESDERYCVGNFAVVEIRS